MTSHALAIIGGDGIGQEVMDQSLKALDAAERRFGFSTDRRDYDLGGRRYLATGEVLSDETLAELDEVDAILLGAVGTPDVPPGVLQLGGTFLVKGGRVARAWADPLPGAHPAVADVVAEAVAPA